MLSLAIFVLCFLFVHVEIHTEVTNGGDGESDDVQQFFIPFRAYCVRKGVR